MIFERPWGILLLGLFAAILVRQYLNSRRSGAPLSVGQMALRTLVVVFVCIAVCRPVLISSDRLSAIKALVDISDSLDREQGETLYRQIQKTASDAGLDLEVIPFSRQVAATPESFGNGSYQKLCRNNERLDIGGTNLERALDFAISSGSAGESRAVLLLSDGWETEGDASSLRQSLLTSGAKLYPVVPSQAHKAGSFFRVANLYAPLFAPTQKSVEIRASIANTTEKIRRGLLEITHDKKVIYAEELSVEPGKERVIKVASDPSQEGIKEINAKLTPLDPGLGASSQTVFLSGEEREKILLVNGSAEDARHLPDLLQTQAYRLKSVLGDNRAELSASLQDYDAVIFNNVALSQLPAGTAERVEQYVNAGGGFFDAWRQ